MEKHLISRSFKRVYTALTSLNLDYLLRKDVLGHNSLIHLKPIIEDIVERCGIIIKNSESISSNTLEKVSDFYYNLTKSFESYNQLSDSDYLVQREMIEESIHLFKDELDSYWEKIAGIVRLSVSEEEIQQKLQEIEQSKNSIDSNRDEIKKTLNDVENLKRSVTAQLDEWKERYNDENISVELVTQGKSFSIQARKNEANSVWWIIGICLSTIVLIITLIYFLNASIEEIKDLKTDALKFDSLKSSFSGNILWLNIAKTILIKGLIISINIYLIRFCVKNYNTCKHNQTVNDQRQASFEVAFHFYNTIVSDRKEEILIMAANSIFSHQQTGYLGKTSEPNNPAIIEKIISKAGDITEKTLK